MSFHTEFHHVPVLLKEAVAGLAIKPDGIYVDGTLGGGGHSSKICSELSDEGVLIAIDRDADAIEAGQERLKDSGCKKYFERNNYNNIKQILEKLGIKYIDGALLDLGLSSHQIDQPARGFSYMNDAPLDMRMDQSQDLTAEDVVNTYSKDELALILKEYGEEKWAHRIAASIVREREKAIIKTTGQLVRLIDECVPKSKNAGHRAKRTFQAIRIEVNQELELLEQGINDFIDVLAPGGRLCVITFHSLEDRIIKQVISKRANPCVCPPGIPMCVCGKTAEVMKITRKPIEPTAEEIRGNPRAGSSKLRICEKI